MALTDNLVGYWKLDESSGNAADSVGTNTGVNTDVTYQAGRINNGALFNSTTDKILFGSVPVTADTSQSATYNIWFKTSSTARQTIMSFGDSATNKGFFVEINQATTNGFVTIDWAGFNGRTSAINVADGFWHMCTVVLSTTVASLFIDATQIGATFTNGSLQILGTGDNGRALGERLYMDSTDRMQGMLDEFGVWSRALSGTEITTLYNSGGGLQYPFTIGGAVNSNFFLLF